MPRLKSMTPFKLRVLNFIEQFYKANQYSPTLREIISGIGEGSTSSIAYAMETLADEGYLTKGVDGQARTQVPTFKEKPMVDSLFKEKEHYDRTNY